ncbi:MAG TPA: winged helix-turn-helix domain-containing protein, partial [Blastocatellia bacterium]|nr:winged helix-turn-helix domain-containing protein [Blastocatellia bacterium]
MSLQPHAYRSKKYVLGDYVLDADRRAITCNGDVVHLPNKPFQVLLYLIEHRDRVVTRQELFDQFWDGKDVYDDTLNKCIGAIRKALGERSENTRFIDTRHREGYCYVGPFEEVIEYSPPGVEIEKTRAVRIIIEEEETQPSGSLEQTAAAASLPGAVTALARRRPYLPVRVAVILPAVTLGAIFLILYLNYSTSVSDQLSNHAQVFPIRSIAVLPLRNLSGDPESEYFTDGLTETFITELSKIEGLKVISRSSMFTFKGKEIDPREVGRRLGVGVVLEGSVRRSGDTVRVETRLVNATDGRVIWAGNTFDR